MYPYELFWGMGLYELLVAVGFFLALVYFRFFCDRAGYGARLQNICIFASLAALVGGYGCAILMQGIYNAIESGEFVLNASTGATFYGGLVGGVGVFLAVYFVAGCFLLPKGEALRCFGGVSDNAAGAIALAHGFGRLGCLFAGCCHGRVTEAWYGLPHAYLGVKVVPTQLYEAIFLFLLCGLLTWRRWKNRPFNLAVYLSLYAIWRFVIEFFRDDDRGATVVSFLSPSQLVALILFFVGTGLFWWGVYRKRRVTADGEDPKGDDAHEA